MDIKKDRDQVLYYYKNQEDLKQAEKELTKLQIRTDTFQGDPVRICPRSNGEHEVWHILLLDTGDKTKDTETLKSALGRFGREFREEL